jgi:hypothetical protein
MRRHDQISLSPSAIDLWRQCPQAWRYRYDQGIRLRDEKALYAVGVVQHWILQEIGEIYQAGVLSQEQAQRAVRERVDARIADAPWDRPPTRTQIDEAYAGATRTWQLLQRLWPDSVVESVEEEIWATHPDDDGVVVGGKVDHILTDRAGRRVLIDFKRTSRPGQYARKLADLGPETLGAAYYTPRDVQAHVYALALAWSFRPLQESWLVKASDGGAMFEIIRTTPTEESLEVARSALLELSQDMRRGPRASDRAYPGKGSCYAFGQPCAFSRLCSHELLGHMDRALVEREDLMRKVKLSRG